MRADGTTTSKPEALARAEWMDRLCQRYGCLPSQLLAEPADTLMQMWAVLAAAAPAPPGTVPEVEDINEANLLSFSKTGVPGGIG